MKAAMSLLHSLLKQVLFAGAYAAGLRSKVRSIQLTNAIALITTFLFLILVSYLILRNGWSTVVQVGFFTIAILLSVIVMNHFHLYNLSRGLMCLIIPVAVMVAVFLPRITMIGQYTY